VLDTSSQTVIMPGQGSNPAQTVKTPFITSTSRVRIPVPRPTNSTSSSLKLIVGVEYGQPRIQSTQSLH